jgi:hypothetical protein
MLQHGLGVKQVNLRGRARHKQEDNPLRAGLEVRRLGREGVVVARRKHFGCISAFSAREPMP